MANVLALNSHGFNEIDSIGEVVKSIRRIYPGSKIALIITPPNEEFTKNSDLVDRYIIFSSNRASFLKFFWKPLSLATLIYKIRREKIDSVAVAREPQNLHPSLKLDLIAFFSGAKEVIEVDFNGRKLNDRDNDTTTFLKRLLRYVLVIGRSKSLLFLLKAAALMIYGYFNLWDWIYKSTITISGRSRRRRENWN